MPTPLGQNEQAPQRPLAEIEVQPVRVRSIPMNGAGGSGPDPRATPLGGLMALLGILRYKWTMLGVFVLVGGLGTAAALLFNAPKYEARGLVMIEPVVKNVLEKDSPIPFYNQFLNTQVGHLRSREVLNRVLEDASVKATDWFRKPVKAPFVGAQSDLDRLLDALTVRVRTGTQFIDVVVEAPKRADAIAIVQSVLSHYAVFSRQQADNEANEDMQNLRTEQSKYEGEIRRLRDQINDFQKRMLAIEPVDVIKQRGIRLDALGEQLSSYEFELKLQGVTLDAATTTQPAGAEATTTQPTEVAVPSDDAAAAPSVAEASPEARQRYQLDPEWNHRDQVVEQANKALRRLRERLGEENYIVKAAQIDLDAAEFSRKKREVQLDDLASAGKPDGGESMGASQRMTKQEMLRRAVALQARVEAAKADLRADMEAMRNYDTVSADLKDRSEKLEMVKNRIFRKESERYLAGNIRVSKDARDIMAPTAPARDRRGVFTAMALFAGLGCAVAVGYLRFTSNRSVRSVSDIVRTPGAPVLGQLPLLDAPKANAASPDDCPITNECMRMVRTALLQRINTSGQAAVVLVTSAGPGAGKTTVCSMLGKSLAHCGKRVLLVEADLRNPRVARHFRISESPGLVSALLGKETQPKQVLLSVGRLDVLPAGTVDVARDTELLANGIFGGFMARWRGQYDVILLDSPPVLPVADARILAQHADGTILVVREGVCRRDEVFEALTSIATAGGNLLGTVFIGKGESLGYGRYGYGPYAYTPRRPQAATDVNEPVGAGKS